MEQISEAIRTGTLLWEPSEDFKSRSRIADYMRWLRQERGLAFDSYNQLWEWSVTDLEGFWASIAEYFRIPFTRGWSRVLDRRVMPGAHWFEGAELNYAQVLFKQATPARPAVVFSSERHPLQELSWAELEAQVAAVAAGLRRLGVARGDRVVAYMPNIPQTLVACLATVSLGAIWSSCAPDFGIRSVLDRFSQIEPRVLFAVDGYTYGGKAFDRREIVAELRRSLPSLQTTVLVPYLDTERTPTGAGETSWAELVTGRQATLDFETVGFEHPLWVLYTSGTTGLPKPIVHSHGGTLVESFRDEGLQYNLGPGSRFFWQTSTSWIMWNALVMSLTVGATAVLYDGNPGYPSLDRLWDMAAQAGVTMMGVSPAFLLACRKAGIVPSEGRDLSRLECLGSTGSPLPSEASAWVYRAVKPDIWVGDLTGGTDIGTVAAGLCAILPVYAGELQCRGLGAKVESFDEAGRPGVNRQGELVITEPMPQMPVAFWNDPTGERYRTSYFTRFPGVWRHGDWITITDRGTAILPGRSDSTLNRHGVRLGTGELYRVIEELPEIVDSLVIGIELPGGDYRMPLFVVLAEGVGLDDALRERIITALRTNLSPRHVPDSITAVRAIPRTLTGKKLELPVKRLFLGVPLQEVASLGATLDPQALEDFAHLAQELGLAGAGAGSAQR
jgi:acetoacetyl-CoA synthetase